MNATSNTAAPLTRLSSHTRPIHHHNPSRSPPQPRPEIYTSLPVNHSFASRPVPESHLSPQARQASSSSIASTTNISLFSHSGETMTTATSSGSPHASTSTASFCADECNSQQRLSSSGSLGSIVDQLHSHVLALHDFSPIGPNATYLSFRAGEIIQVLNRDASGWWDGELEGRRGWFPSNYVSGLDQVGRLKDEVLVELHKTSHHESTPSLASWTSALSSSSAVQAEQTPAQTPMLPTFTTHSDQLLAEPPPEYTSPETDASHNSENDRPFAGTLSPTSSLYRAIADGDVSPRAFSPTPSFSTSHHSRSPRLTPLFHALSLLHRAVASRRQAHYQPSTACVISCVRSLLTSAECLHRDAPTLQRVPQLAQERKIILGNLATLVSQARRCSDWPGGDTGEDGAWDGTAVAQAEVEQQDWELEQMLRMGGEVLRNVTQFLDICQTNNVELPVPRNTFAHTSSSGSSGSEKEMQQRLLTESGVPQPYVISHKRAQHGFIPTLRRGTGSDGAHEATHVPAARPLDNPVPLSAMRTKSLNDLRERRRMQHLERSRQLHPVPMPNSLTNGAPRLPLRSAVQQQFQGPEQHSISSMSSLSSGSLDSYGSLLPLPFPSGPCSTAQVLSSLRVTHDDLLSSIAAFIGHVHSYGRHLHASSKGHLIELAREIVDMVRQLLTLVEAVARHPDVGAAKVEALQEAKNALFSATNELVEAVRETTSPTTDVSEEEERRRTLHGATGVLKIAADCVAAVKICLSRPLGEEPFIICLPSLSSNGTVPLLPGTAHNVGKGQRPVSFLRRRSVSVTSSMQGLEQLVLPQHVISVVTEDGETHAEDEMTIHPVHVPMPPPVDIPMREVSSGGSESTVDEESDEGLLLDNRSRRPSRSFPPKADAGRESTDSPEEKEPCSPCSPFEEKLLHGDLPVPPSESSTVPPTPLSPNPPLTPLDVDSVFASLLSHDYDIRDIAYNAEGSIVGATLDVMIEKMTPHDALVDPAFHQIFMMTWHLFVSPSELVSALIERYNLRAPAVLQDSDREVWVKRKATPIKLRVSNFIKTWLENYWRPDTDDTVLTQLSQFVRGTVVHQFPAPAQRILEIIRARTISDNSFLNPRPIDRTKSVDRLREGPPSLPPPVTLSEIPRPTINKTLFAALKTKAFENIAITDFDALELARQFTVMESKLYLRVQPEEVLELGQPGGVPATNVKAISTLSTAITGWVTESILDESDTKKRTHLVKFFIKVADRCLGLNNYSTSRSILAALDSSTISRLQQTWVALPQKSKVQLEALRKMADHARNYSAYRSRLRNTSPPAVPFLGLYLTDVTFCREGNPSHRNSPRDPSRKLVNFNKYHKLARIVQDMQRFQVPYNLKEIPEVQNYLVAQFDDAKNGGDLHDLYRRSLLVEPRRPADSPISSGDGKPMLQIWGLGTLSRSQTSIPLLKSSPS
ncbi:hypothetical protein JB92DRAFT_2962662 [Gautieria morchelliformis]|nr:hypothetical protein JB92DRAFT_2962662 [Gautieria morchelliformis]